MLARFVSHAQSAAQVKGPDGNAHAPQAIHQRHHLVERLHHGRGIQQLRSDVATDAFQQKVRVRRGLLVERLGLADIDSEFVFPQPGGDVRMGGGIDVRVHAERNARLHAAARGQRFDQNQLRFGLAIEAVDAALKRVFDLVGGLAYARKYHLGRIAAGFQHPEQFSARYDVEARPGLG